MNFRRGKNHEQPEINLIPFIDVLLVILIFLMVTTTYSKFSELQITLPTANAEKPSQRLFELNVSVNANGDFAINNERILFVSVSQLASEMQKRVPKTGDEKGPVVIISADGAAHHQHIIHILEAARLAGLDRVTFATQVKSE